MKYPCVLFSVFSLFLISLCSGSWAMAAHSDTGVGSPTEVPLIAFVWQDLFGEPFDAGDDAMFIRSDKPASTSFGDGFELAVLTLDGEGDADEEYVGAVFIEESRYPDEDFPEQSGFLQGEHDGATMTVRWRFWLDAVSGRIINAAGQSRIVSAYVYVVDFEGMGAYADGGLRIENLVPVKRMLSLSAADDFAFMLSGLETPRVDLQDCAHIDPADVCALALCQCENRANQKLDDELDLCDSWGPISWSFAAGCAIPAGGGAGAAAGAKRGGLFGIAVGAVVGACAGVIAGELTLQSYEKGACRMRARTAFGKHLNWAMNEFNDCNERVPPSYNCPINP
jgi:hypothetical protein